VVEAIKKTETGLADFYAMGVAVVKAHMIHRFNKGEKADEAVGFVDALA